MPSVIDDEQLAERYFERCAIQEFEAGQARIEATEGNFAKLVKWCKSQGRDVPDCVIRDFETVKKELQRGK